VRASEQPDPRTPGARAPVETLRWEGGVDGHLALLDQTRLPGEELVLAIRDVPGTVDAIRRLAVRGAPAIGVAAAYGVVLGVRAHAAAAAADVVARTRAAADELAGARPTAVNLSWAVERAFARARAEQERGADGAAIVAALLDEARAIHREDAASCRRIGELGAELLADGMGVLTHCNAGALATAGIGTALAPIYVAHERGRRLHVFADETRPLLQGARLTAWELARAGVDVTLLTDGMAASAMRAGKVQAVIVGADRIARNGDVCNKIGTYGVAILARRHAIPFYVAAPLSTFDPAAADGSAIPIEERADDEVQSFGGVAIAPAGVRVWNPAFDVTPHELVTAILTERGRIDRPGPETVEAFLRAAERL